MVATLANLDLCDAALSVNILLTVAEIRSSGHLITNCVHGWIHGLCEESPHFEGVVPGLRSWVHIDLLHDLRHLSVSSLCQVGWVVEAGSST